MSKEQEQFLSVADETNQNLTRAQKELLKWHWKLGHAGFTWVQQLLRSERNGEEPIIKPKIATASSCPAPLCAACLLARLTRVGAGVSTELKDPDHEMSLKVDHLLPGQVVSMDQYQSSIRGRLEHTYGKEKDDDKYTGGTIFVDHASTKLYIRHQVSLRAGETVVSKRMFEQDCKQHGVNVKHYHADNGVFDTAEFMEEINKHEQTIDFSGVGAKHQNGVAERAIRTVTEWARAMLLHAALHWPEQARIDIWPFAMDYAVYLYNNMPKRDLKIAPLELFSNTKIDPTHLRRLHVFGCPTFVLDPKLQDGKKLPKWNPRSRRGQFLGYSKEHSTTIGQILNLRTGYITPQFHVVYDDFFQTAHNEALIDGNMLPFDEIEWENLFRDQRERYIEEDLDEFPELNDEWLDQNEIDQQNHENRHRFERNVGRPPGQVAPVEREPIPIPVQEQPQHIQAINEEDDEEEELPVEQVEQPVEQPLPLRRSQRQRRPNPRYVNTNRKVRMNDMNQQYLMNLDWSMLLQTVKSKDLMNMICLMEQHTDPITNMVEEWHPMLLSTMANANDNPTYHQAMNGPDRQGYEDAMDIELETLQGKDSWDVVQRTSEMNVLDSTWAFKCKRYPDGSIRKLKARFCVRGDQQIEGVDFFDTYAPVVQWATVRLLLMVSLMLNLATQQVDYTAAFLHAPLEDEVYCEMPRGYREPGKVLKLKRSLYGLRQSPRNFFEHLKGKLLSLGFEQSMADPCLFIHEKVICVTYVDDCLFYAPKQEYITEMIENLRRVEMELNVEDDVAGFLGVKIERTDDRIVLTQVGLIERIISAMGLEGAKSVKTPTTEQRLPKDENGEPCNETFNYASVVGMLMYLAGNTRPDISFAVHQCARYTHSPKHSHEIALKRIGRYLVGTRDRGLILQPTKEIQIDMYVDADFAGLWGYEDKDDPACVKSRSGYVILVGNCPVIWGSKLQSLIALSTMEAEYIALSDSMKHLLVLKRLAIAICEGVQLDPVEVASIWSTVFEDNSACEILANMEPPRSTPRSKHIAIKYHWFREALKPNNIKIVPIATEEQIADIFTKGLKPIKFEKLRKKLLGW